MRVGAAPYLHAPWCLGYQIRKIGFYSDFHVFRDKLDKYPLDELLVMSDNEERYGQNWVICLTAEAFERETGRIEAEKRAAEEAEAAAAAAAEAAAAEEEAAATAVYEEKPVVARPYESASASETVADVESLRTTRSRPLQQWLIVRRRREFGKRVVFADKDGGEHNAKDFRQQRNPNFELTRRELSIGLQDGPGYRSGTAGVATQTTWFRPTNSAVQSDAISVPADAVETLTKPEMTEFLGTVAPLCEHALQQNETINIFQDELALLDDEEMMVVGSQGENDVRELRTFMDLEFSQNKSLLALDWHPKNLWVVASAGNNWTFEGRVELSGHATAAHVLFYTFSEFSAQVILESSHEITCFRWNPSNPTTIVAGCTTGQVMMWDLEAALGVVSRRAKMKGGDKGDGDEALRVRPKFTSTVDGSHKRAVRQLTWLPSSIELNHRHEVVERDQSAPVAQFVTCAADGQLLVWDTRRDAARAKGGRGGAGGSGDGEEKEVPWNPSYRCMLMKPDGSGELGLSCFDLHPTNPAGPCMAGTEEGEVLLAEWAPGGSRAAERKAPTGAEEGDGEGAPQRVQWVSREHYRPIVSLVRSPFFPELVAAVADQAFSLYREDMQQPLFTSPVADAQVTCGRWSPSRPALLLIAKANGFVDVWDLLDSTRKPSLVFPVVSTAVTCMEFRPRVSGSSKQLLAAGDFNGNLHVLDMPQQLRRRAATSKNAMAAYLEREAERVSYTGKRAAIRSREYMVSEAAREKEEAEAERAEKAEEALLETEGIDKEQLERKRALAALEKAEKEYQELEASVREMLGVTEEYDVKARRQQLIDAGLTADGPDDDGAGGAGAAADKLGASVKLGRSVDPDDIGLGLGETS